MPERRATSHVASRAALRRARELFLDDANTYGCAETTFMVLKEAFGLADAADPAAALALNGGVAYSGGVCGAITGAALAVGLLAARGSADHASAKRVSREAIADLVEAFEAEFGSLNCRDLIGRDIRSPEAHAAFIASDVWRTTCMRQIEFAVARCAALPRSGHLALSSDSGAA
jgi:C_GCAxxG_C_C family probable redox protein